MTVELFSDRHQVKEVTEPIALIIFMSAYSTFDLFPGETGTLEGFYVV